MFNSISKTQQFYKMAFLRCRGLSLRFWPDLVFFSIVLASVLQGLKVFTQTDYEWPNVAGSLFLQAVICFIFGATGAWFQKSLLKKGIEVGYFFYLGVGAICYGYAIYLIFTFISLSKDEFVRHPALMLSPIGYAYLLWLRRHLNQMKKVDSENSNGEERK